MKTKGLKKVLAALFFAPVIFTACEEYEADEILVKLTARETQDTTPITQTQNTLAVLIEDFTGWNCPNCPEGTSILSSLKETYGERLIVSAVHQGSFARPKAENNNLDLRTPYGDELGSKFGLSSWPNAVINRKIGPLGRGDWETKIQECFANGEHLMNISLGAENTQQGLLVSLQVEAVKDVNEALMVTLFITESDIHGVQNNQGTMIEDYSFQHVLRNNPIVDMPLATTGLNGGDKVSKNYYFTSDKSLNLNNCAVVAFVSNSAGEVLQVNEIEINKQ
ncbi:MAG: Omp28 family outer membrane lipoprotein [Candidatus Onthomorpha sp.]